MVNKNLKPTYREIKRYSSKKRDDIFMYLYRILLTFHITKYLVRTNITPTTLTIISFILSLIAATFFLFGEYGYLIWGVILMQLSFILDCVDGEVARFKGLVSDFGAWFDTATDGVMLAIIFTTLSIGQYNISKN